MISLDIRKIESVCAVATYLSYTEAAYHIASSPSVISKHIASVEEELGVSIFRRATKSSPVELTEVGEKIIPCLQEIQRQHQQALSIASDARKEQKELLRVGYFQQIGSFRENSILAGYAIENPDVIVLRRPYAIQSLVTQLLNDAADAVFLPLIEGCTALENDFSRLQDGNFIITEIVRTNKLFLGFPQRHPLRDREEIREADFPTLANETFLFPAAEIGADLLPPVVSRKLGMQGKMHVRYIDFSERILPSNIMESDGCLLPQLCFVPEKLGQIRFVPVEGSVAPIRLYLIYRKSADKGALHKLNEYVLSSSAQFYEEFPFVSVPAAE